MKFISKILIFALIGWILDILVYWTHLDRWASFITYMVFGTASYMLSYSIMFSFCINEYVMAEGAVFMSQNVDKPNTPELWREIGSKWKQLWIKRDRALFLYNVTLFTLIMLTNISNIVYILWKRKGKLYPKDQS